MEDETAVCFIGTFRDPGFGPVASHDLTEYTGSYLSRLGEMVNNHRNHPSVIICSIGNENEYGENFSKSYRWVKEADPTRPVIFSFFGTVPDSIRVNDIVSIHYPDCNGDKADYRGNNRAVIKAVKSFGYDNMPVLCDEWAHVACYNRFTISEDPNIRDFWGQGLDKMWQRLFDTEGGLGGAIWGMIDETFMLPEDLPGFNEWWPVFNPALKYTGHNVGCGEWGVIDVWREKKPEFINVKKAYSPVRVLRINDYDFIPGKTELIQVYNRFDFTNLSEINIRITQEGKSSIIQGPDLAPHKKGNLSFIPVSSARQVGLEFLDNKGNLIDSYLIKAKSDSLITGLSHDNGRISLKEHPGEYVITCSNGLGLTIDKSSGLFKSIRCNEREFGFSGPSLNLRAMVNKEGEDFLFKDLGTEWKMQSVDVHENKNSVKIILTGNYSGNLKADFLITIYPDGYVTTDYKVINIPEILLREAGIKYVFDDEFDTLTWKRIPYWSDYPEGHMSAATGKIPLYTSGNMKYRENPVNDWGYDKKSFYYSGTGSENSLQLINAAKATKEKVIDYNLKGKAGPNVSVNGRGTNACRIEKNDDRISLMINNEIDYPDLSWLNYTRNIKLKNKYEGSTEMSIHTTHLP